MAKIEADNDQGPVRYFKEQFEDEEVVLVFKKHPVVMRKGLIFAAVGMLIPMLYIFVAEGLFNNPPTMNMLYACLGIGFGLATLIMFPYWISWNYSVYIMTDQRLIQINQRGLFRRSMVAIGLDQVQMVNYEIDGLEETLLGFGTIVVQTFVGSLTINDVHHPAKIQKKMLHLLRDMGYTNPQGQMMQEGTDEG